MRQLDENVLVNLSFSPFIVRCTYNNGGVIVSYADKDTEKLTAGIRVKKFEAIARAARKKLVVLRAATCLEDLMTPAGNRLEALSGDRKGQHSIRINDQYGICFEWKDGNAHNVEIVDYH